MSSGAAGLDCPSCGRRLALPAGLAECATFVCGACSERLRNDARTRAFRYEERDPFVRRWGVTRPTLWAMLLGACLWLVLFAVLLAAGGRLDGLLLALLAAPYLAIVAWLVRGRVGVAALPFVTRVVGSLGLYLLWIALLVRWRPEWGELFEASGSSIGSASEVGALGAALAAAALGGRLAYRAWSRRQPVARPVEGD